MRRKQPEFLLHCVCADYLRKQYPSLLWFHPANGEARSLQTGARLKRMGVRPGTPDIMLFWEDSQHFPQIGCIELKADRGKLTDTQTEFMLRIISIGGQYAICKTLDEMVSWLTQWRVPKN